MTGAIFGEVGMECDTYCSAHCKWRFICGEDQACKSFCVAGALFWRGWRVTPVAPRIVNDVSCVVRIKHASHFAWQAHYFGEVGG